MKIYLPLIVVGILLISGLGAGAEFEDKNEKFISETVAFSEINIVEENNYVTIDIPEATYDLWETEKPLLPVVTKVYTYPIGTTIKDVEVYLSDISQIKISKPVIPTPELYMDSISITNEIKKPDTIQTYDDIDVYPDFDFRYKTGAGLKGEDHVIYLSVGINPVKYLPNENTIQYAKNAKIDISYRLPENPLIFPDEYDYLIITAPQFESTLQRLADHKNSLNPPVRTIMVTLDDIPTGVGVDIQEDIKFYIKDAIENWGITYVLLVGAGEEGHEVFPVRQAWIGSGNHEDYFPSDLYFADIYNSTMEFSDWDYNENGKFAEWSVDMEDIDILPDVYLSKIPCNSTYEVNSFIDKVIYYKQHNKMTNRIMQAGGDSFTSDDIYEGEYANTKVLEKLPGYTSSQYWASTDTLTKSNIADGFKSSVDFFDFCGHGNWAAISTHAPKDDEKWVPEETLRSPYHGFLYFDFDLYFVNNAKKYPVCVYKSCSNSKYTDSDKCFGWKTVSKRGGGGIASYAASGISYGSTGIYIVERTTGWMEVKSFEKLIEVKSLGQIWGESVTDYHNAFQSKFSFEDWKTMLEWTLMGDPTLVVENGDDPEPKSNFNFDLFSRIFNKIPILQWILQKLKL